MSRVLSPARFVIGGFTLIELVVSLSLAALAIAVVPVAIERVMDNAQYRSTVRELLTTMRSARQTAMRSGTETVFQIDPVNRRYGQDGQLVRVLPEGLSVEVVVAGSEVDHSGVGSIRFYPDGSATGGSVVVRRASGDGVQLRVGWLLGRISQHPV